MKIFIINLSVLVLLLITVEVNSKKLNKSIKHKLKKYSKHMILSKALKLRHRKVRGSKQINPDINVVGSYKPGLKNTLEKFPYDITSCDQTAFIQGKRLLDLNDYSKQKDSYYSINAYYIFEFESKDVNTLRSSELVHEIKNEPSILMGAPGCVKTDKLHICFDTKEKALNIIDVINRFKFCKLGVGLDTNQILSVVRGCKLHHSGLGQELQSQGLVSTSGRVKTNNKNKVNWNAWTDIVPGS